MTFFSASGTEGLLNPAQARHQGQSLGLFALLALSVPLVFVYVIQSFLFVRGIQDVRVFVCLMELFFIGIVQIDGRYTREASWHLSTKAGLLFLAWLGAASISVALSDHGMHALIRHAEWICHILFAYTLWSYLQRDLAQVKWVLLFIPLGFFLTGLILLASWFAMPNPANHNWFTGAPIFGHIRYMGYYALAGVLFSMPPLLGLGGAGSMQARLTAAAAMAFCWGFLFWTGGRAAIGAAIAGIGVVFWFAHRRHRLGVAMVSVLSTGAGLWLSTFFVVNSPHMGFLRSIERTTAATSANAITTGRMEMWQAAADAIRENPWFGLGPEGYLYLETKLYGVQPHNLLLQFLIEWGVLGTILFVAGLALVFYRALVLLRRDTQPLRRAARVIGLALIVAFTVHSLVDGLYYHAVPLMLLFTSIALVLLPVSSSLAAPTRSPLAALASPLALRVSTAVLILLFVGYYVILFVY